MDAWRDIRLRARACRVEALKHSKGAIDGRAIVNGALKADDLELRYFTPGVEVSANVYGSLERNAGLVNVATGLKPEDELCVIAHEIGHYKLHRDPQNEVTVIAPILGGDPVDSGAGRVEGYSPRERKEVQAEVFAGEFLCPTDWLRDQLLGLGKQPRDVATDLGLPYGLVLNQTIRALLLPPLQPLKTEVPAPQHDPDDTQLAASSWNKGPLLLNAGPGTGKTRTLINRISRTLAAGASSASFLALTFSNKAAEEMRERLLVNGHDTVEMWVGTFHAFGLEIVLKWPSAVGRSQKVKILDQTAQLALLEANLHRLPLYHYQNLFEPAYELVPILRAISRCKDELVSPEEYLAAAEASARAAQTEEQREKAEKALEIAAVYKIYEELLQADDAVDFGDLIALPILILDRNPQALAELRQRFQHILIDEYQDVNFASAQFLRRLATASTDLWVVADQRQSIYRFRGAEPSNVERFEREFGGQSLALGSNYRSGAPVVRAFQAFTTMMGTGKKVPNTWRPQRGETGSVSLTVAPTVGGEAAAIRDQIVQLSRQGVALRDQVVLARSHLTLSRITGVLEELGVPLLYLGDLFERDEIRDLLSLLSLDVEYGGVGLLRVGRFEEYSVPEHDILTFLDWCRVNESELIAGLQMTDGVVGLSEKGRTGLQRLGRQLVGFSRATSPWAMLTTWLFERSGYLRPLIQANDAKSRQKLIAIYQLLKVCGEFAGLGEASRRKFLDRVRRIEALNEDTVYRAVSSEATDLDAVRVMTIHGSKGLEFGAVHLPAIATRYMPSGAKGNRCPPPVGLERLGMESVDHDAEEECLFFVALSRAKDHLSLSRAERYTTQISSASRFLGALSRLVPQKNSPDWPVEVKTSVYAPPPPRAVYEERELAIYDRCALRYRYEVVDGLAGAKDSTAYVRFHGCVHRTIDWLEERQSKGTPADEAAALEHLATVWAESGPKHGFERYYRQAAEKMVRTMAQVIANETGSYDRDEWAVQLNGKTITFTPDRVVLTPGGNVLIQRVRTGRKTKTEAESEIYALLRRGAATRYPGRKVAIETFYPATGERVPVAVSKNDAKSIKSYVDAISHIEVGNFPKTADTRYCPNCPCYFICGT